MSAYETGAVVIGGVTTVMWARQADNATDHRNSGYVPRIAIYAVSDAIDSDNNVVPATAFCVIGANKLRTLRSAIDQALANEPEAA